MPRFYLDLFGNGRRVGTRWRDGKDFVASTANVAVESGMYALEPTGAPGANDAEKWLSQIEGEAARVFRQIAEGDEPPAEDSDERFLFAGFLALQVSRTPEHRELLFFASNVVRSPVPPQMPLAREGSEVRV